MRRAAALAKRIARESAGTRIHRPDEHEARRERCGPRRARHGHRPLFERLPQDLENMAAELEHFVEEQHSVVREADFARPRIRSAADERRVGDCVVRRAKRTDGQQPCAWAEEAGDRVNRRRLERFRERQRRQDPRDPTRHHRLACAGRTDQQQIVSARGRDLERTPSEQLAADVGEIERVGSGR